MNVRHCDESGLQAAKAWRDFRLFSWSFCVRWLVAACRSASVLLRTNTVPRFKRKFLQGGRVVIACGRSRHVRYNRTRVSIIFNSLQFTIYVYI